MIEICILATEDSPRLSLGELSLLALAAYALLAFTGHLRYRDFRLPLSLAVVGLTWYVLPYRLVSEILSLILFGWLLFARRRRDAGEEESETS